VGLFSLVPFWQVISDKAKKLTAASSGKDDGSAEARSKLKELKVRRGISIKPCSQKKIITVLSACVFSLWNKLCM